MRYSISIEGDSPPSKGTLDVDANGADGPRPDPCENIYYAKMKGMTEGVYTLFVHQFNQRQKTDVGFEAEIDILGTLHHFSYANEVRGIVEVAKLKYSKSNGVEIIESLPPSSASKNMWGVASQQFHKVSMIMNSPNHWDENTIGNKHTFFILEGCKNEGNSRGFYNEFLKSDLDVHRKVFEVLGAKMRVEPSDNQLSGLGFSSTQRNHVFCKVTGAFTRTLKIKF